MGRCLNNPVEFIKLVRDQYRWYLHTCNQECLVKDLGRLNDLIREFDKLKDDELCKQDPIIELDKMHTFAHKLAQARIRLRGGRFVLDNPPIPY